MATPKQPQGIHLDIDADALPDVGYFSNEVIEDGQVTLPNHITVRQYQESASTLMFYINDAILHTHHDEIVVTVHNYSPAAANYVFVIPTESAPVTKDDLNSIPAASDNMTVKQGTTYAWSVRKVNGEYFYTQTQVGTVSV